MNPEYIVIHTAAFRGRNCDAAKIDQWHRNKGWNGIGYHYVILNDRHDQKSDGTVEEGRPLSQVGAHARGINSRSIGICCAGHGDDSDFTPAQYTSLGRLVTRLMQQFSVPLEHVIGHREINQLIQAGLVSDNYRTSKSCPGNAVNMDELRRRLGDQAADTAAASDDELRQALELMRDNRSRFGNAQDELADFLNHPEVIEFVEQ